MRNILLLVLVCCIAASSQMPYTFQADSVAKADEVNANFTFLSDKIDSLMGIVDTLNANKLAIGTVIGTMVGIDTTTGIWVLADGRSASPYIEFIAATGMANIPDLRGMFLRGLNEGRNDGKQDPEAGTRTAGSYQADTLKSHSHLEELSSGENKDWYGGGDHGGNFIKNTAAFGGLETRPRNSAVYWYIKVR